MRSIVLEILTISIHNTYDNLFRYPSDITVHLEIDTRSISIIISY